MKLSHLVDSLLEDFKVICAAHSVLFSEAAKPEEKTGLKTMWTLLGLVSRDRAYDDSHPLFESKAWRRVLPYDGRDFCFYYENGANDAHVTTLLREVQRRLYDSPAS